MHKEKPTYGHLSVLLQAQTLLQVWIFQDLLYLENKSYIYQIRILHILESKLYFQTVTV